MEKITRHYKFDYENDTTIEYVNTGLYSMLNCSFTSEDPNYGTDTLHYTAQPSVSMGQMAYEYVKKVTRYLDFIDGDCENEIADLKKMFGDYSNSTMYAIEKALKDIAEEYHAKSWFGHLEDVCRGIAKRMIKDGQRKFSFCESNQDEWDRYSPEEYEQMGCEWYGVKRLDPVFDEGPNEYIVAIGYYGGGCFTSAYVCDYGSTTEYTINYLARSICNGIMKITSLKEQSIVFATEEDEGK